MFLKIYLDESKSKNAAPEIFVLAGIIANADSWVDFEVKWIDALRETPLGLGGNVRPFHMTDFENRQGDFKDWDNADRIALIKRLLRLINNLQPIRIVSSISVTDFDEVLRSHGLTYDEKWKRRALYHICLIRMISKLERIQIWGPGKLRFPRIPLVFDRNDAVSGSIQYAWDRECKLRPWLDPSLGPVIFESKEIAVPLQAADIVAYEEMKHILNEATGRPRPTRKSYAQFEQQYRIHHDVNESELLSVALALKNEDEGI